MAHTFEWRHADDPEKKGQTIWSPFAQIQSILSHPTKDFMINFRVENLEWLLGELKKEGMTQ